MSDVQLETELLDKDEIKGLSADRKERYYSKIIKEIVEQADDGITRKEISNITGFGEDTVSRHLNKLVATNFAYLKKFGRTKVWFPNGKTLHASDSEEFEMGEYKYGVYRIQNPSGKYVYIQEKKRDELGAETLSGGIMVEEENFDKFVERLRNTYHRGKQNDQE